MKTVKEISRITGVSVRTLHHYDAIGLLRPTCLTEAGYRLYDDTALERLYLIILFRELGFPLKKISAILDAPDFDRNQALDAQLTLLEEKRQQLLRRMDLARGIRQFGISQLELGGLHMKKINDHEAQAKALYGKTEAWQEYSEKSKGRSADRSDELGQELMAHFARLGRMKDLAPGSETVQNWVRELQAFITAHYYNCTPQILSGLGEMYAAGGSMTENIDKAGGAGTGELARDAIRIYCAK